MCAPRAGRRTLIDLWWFGAAAAVREMHVGVRVGGTGVPRYKKLPPPRTIPSDGGPGGGGDVCASRV